ncbi:hypothetical protein PFICI_06450 [Pestalotiopsis fici W106-1]|uniref:non-specific serine/threonine protein kinase n=1 Tax=Pestalotiopsis fici (strain W106-1 / CGMCC3.15140) TaxID=1229662 RepID=W3X5P4_PESFW|nr:uncharacterized protein PFICI_06450 [Pestalotiopsis fici W106-1]ETS81448.1 hypothetical protein PFICI_06450 [Pestalotiopsis fici W106-1]
MAKPVTANEEIRRVPPGWRVMKTVKTGRVHYHHPRDAPNGTFVHPVLGKLPHGWQMVKAPGLYLYYNTVTRETTKYRPSQPLSQPSAAPKGSGDSSAQIVPRNDSNRPGSIAPPVGFAKVRAGMKLERNTIASTTLEDKYDVVKIIDPGDGTKGGMNAGIFVVRKKCTSELFIQKNFKSDNDFMISLVKNEIKIMRELRCNSLATVYMEFCDCGDLGQLISSYKKRKKADPSFAEYIPESFIWHAFLALIDGLHFLATGSSYLSIDLNHGNNNSTNRAKKIGKGSSSWTPIVHRDIKPDNVMLKSRSTPGSSKPLYVILTDFGMAEREAVAAEGPPWLVYGTPEYHAPELCFAPFLTTSDQLNELASPHTPRSDIWAVAAIMHALCERNVLGHSKSTITFTFNPAGLLTVLLLVDMTCWTLSDPAERELRWRGRAARKQVLQITDRSVYSDRLEYCIKYAGDADPKQRPDARILLPRLQTYMEIWRADPNWKAQTNINCKLPDWAVEKSDLV